MPLYFDQYGLRFAVAQAFPEDAVQEANDYMTAQPGVGVLATSNGLVLLASLADKGQPLTAMKCAICEADAGQHVQFADLNPGWGLCRGCLVRRKALGISPDEIAARYGTEGLNFEAASGLYRVERERVELASSEGGSKASVFYVVMSDADEVVGRYLTRGLAERVRDRLSAGRELRPINGTTVANVEALTWHADQHGRAFILEPDGTTVCEILAPALNSRATIARDLVHAQLSAVKLLAAARELVASLAKNDPEGLIEHAEPMVAMREAIAYAEGKTL